VRSRIDELNGLPLIVVSDGPRDVVEADVEERGEDGVDTCDPGI
jgi:hypothetical protein